MPRVSPSGRSAVLPLSPSDRPGPPTRARAAMGEVLLVTADARLDESVARLSALAGRAVSATTASDLTGRSWAAASIVIVGMEATAAVADRGLPRRDGVLVVARERDHRVDQPELLRAVLAVGAEDVLPLPDAEARLLRRLTAAHRPGRAAVVGVVGARGGAGATTLACALGLTAAREGLRAALVDADPLGGGVDRALGTEEAPGARWSHLLRPRLAVGESTLHRLLPDLGGLHVLSFDEPVEAGPDDGLTGAAGEPAGGIPPGAFTAVLASLRLSHDVVVVDLPRQWPQGVAAALDVVGTVVLITPAEVRATAAGACVLHRLRHHVDDVRLVVRGPAPGGLSGEVVAGALGLRLTAELPPEPGLDAAYERGLPPARRRSGPLATCAQRLLGVLTLQGTAAA